MEEARRKLFEKAIKKFTIKELVKHQSIGSGQKNLIELISRYPGFGRDFKVFKKTWPENSYYKIKQVELFVSCIPNTSHFYCVEWTLWQTSRDEVLERRACWYQD